MIINILRQNRGDATVAKQLANEDEDTGCMVDGGQIDPTDTELSIILDLTADIGASNSETGTHTGTSTPLSVDLTSDAEYFTPLGSPDESRRSSIISSAVPLGEIRSSTTKQVLNITDGDFFYLYNLIHFTTVSA